MNYQDKLVEAYPEDDWEDMSALAKKAIDTDISILSDQLLNKQRILNCFAYVGNEMVAYKIGFQQRPGYFESWIGVVDPKYRRLGIATTLMNAQHQWAQEAGFKIIETITTGDNQAMLLVNIKGGFEVCGTFLDRRKNLKVILQKMLDS